MRISHHLEPSATDWRWLFAQSLPRPDQRVWVVRAEDIESIGSHTIVDTLAPDEVARAGRLLRAQDQKTFLAVHMLLRLLLAKELRCPPALVPLVRRACTACGGPHGRPSVDDGEIEFSVSHSRTIGLVALGRQRVGVDIEAVPDESTVTAVAPRLHPRERAEIARVPAIDRPRTFTEVWTRSEAYLKGIGAGLCREPSLDYVGTTERPGRAVISGWRIHEVTVGPLYVAALAEEEGPLTPVGP